MNTKVQNFSCCAEITFSVVKENVEQWILFLEQKQPYTPLQIAFFITLSITGNFTLKNVTLFTSVITVYCDFQ